LFFSGILCIIGRALDKAASTEIHMLASYVNRCMLRTCLLRPADASFSILVATGGTERIFLLKYYKLVLSAVEDVGSGYAPWLNKS